MVVLDSDLAGTIRFAMKATKELDLLDSRSEETAVEKLAVELGHEVAKALVSRKRNGAGDVLAALAPFWSENQLGNMVFIQSNPATIRLSGCYDCDKSRMGGALGPCTFKKSLLETVFRDALGATVHVDELECCKTGGAACVFRLGIT